MNNYIDYFLKDNKSGWKCVESKLRNKNHDLYQQIISFNDKHQINLNFKEKIWYFINNETKIVLCNECGEKSKFLDLRRGYQEFCSNKCSNKNISKINRVKESTFNNTGYTSPIHNPQLKEKILKTVNNKYSVNNVFQSNIIKEKIRRVNKEKYGNEYPSKTESVKDKIKKTNNEKYGFDSHLSSPDMKCKIQQIFVNKYNVINPGQINSVKEKIKQTNIEKIGYSTVFLDPEYRKKYNGKNSKIECYVRQQINGEKFTYSGKEYDIKVGDDIFEIDGDYFHPDNINHLSITQLNSIINDYEKDSLIKDSHYKLYRIKSSKLNNINEITTTLLKSLSYSNNFNLNYSDIIISKEYFKNYINKYGKDKLLTYVPLMLKFIRVFQKQFPYHNDDTPVTDIINQIRKTKKPIIKGNELNNNTSSVGVGYLKSKFNGYWSSKYNGGKSPVDVWYDDDIMLKIISWRIGINDSGEVYDLSLKNIIRGMGAIRKTISFFKPTVASTIYRHYLGDIKNPVVFDPCSGFGGRLLGFMSEYPEGKYIGVDYNKDTCDSYTHFSGVGDYKVYNSKLEDFNIDFNYDIAFTSIPYFDLEVYSENPEYKDFEEWKDTFIKKLISIPNLIVNMSEDLCYKLGLEKYIDLYLLNSKNHLNKKGKREVILKITENF